MCWSLKDELQQEAEITTYTTVPVLVAYLSWCNQEHSWYFQTWCTCQKFKPQSGQKNGGQCQADPPLAPLILQTSSPWGQWCNQDLHPNHPWVQCRITHEPEEVGPSTCLAQPPDSPSKWSAPAVLHYIKKKKTNKKTWRQRRKEIKGSFWKGSNLFLVQIQSSLKQRGNGFISVSCLGICETPPQGTALVL